MSKRRNRLAAATLCFGYALLSSGAARGELPPLRDATPTRDWALIGGNDYEQHFSPLRQISADTVRDLKLEWYAELPTLDGLTGIPLVADGVIYQSGGRGKAWAHDARTGRLIWEFDAGIESPLGVVPSWGARLSRGLALSGDRVLKATGDCRLFALDRRSGRKIWEARTCDTAQGRTITGAPRVGDGKVFIGSADADTAAGRGAVDAYDIVTGRHLWRFYTIPGDPAKGFESPLMEAASKTWAAEYWKKAAGGSPWEGITYDPRTDLVYIGTDGASPIDPALRGHPDGDEWFTAALVAVKADTGEYVWHYATTPGDGWNYSSTMPVVLADVDIDGQRREVVLNAPKNGFFYVHDARTGKLLNEPKPIVPVNWASRIDLGTGRPVTLPDAQWWRKSGEGTIVSPSPMGARNWMPMSYSPLTGLVYIPVTDYPARIARNRDQIVGAAEIDFYHGLRHGGRFKGILLAWDPLAQAARWQRDIGRPYQGGTLATAGNLVFQGTTSGNFVAYRADNGETLWSFRVGSGILGAPSTVEIDGTQMVFVAAGSGSTSSVSFAPEFSDRADGPARLLAFSLSGSASLPAVTAVIRTLARPEYAEPDQDLAGRGKRIWDANGCELCHGVQAVGGSGSLPDVRRSAGMSLEAFSVIVRGGAFQTRGMPVYADAIAESDLAALQAYIREQAWRGYRLDAAADRSLH